MEVKWICTYINQKEVGQVRLINPFYHEFEKGKEGKVKNEKVPQKGRGGRGGKLGGGGGGGNWPGIEAPV